jgi:lipopolysaccharide transport system ATP-binding protein
MPDAITITELGKRFRRYDPDRVWTLQEAFFTRLRGHRPAEYFWGLQEVTFSVRKGRTVGLIGRNGAGKSTLLRLIGGIGRPDKGTITVQGRISGLLDLGVGFHPDLTGRENVFISGVIGGLTRREIADRYESIVEFSELRAFMESPLRTYSSGMHMRLAFSVAIHTEPDILLVDEVLAVGDIGFQRKCLARIAEFKERGCTIVLVSHDPGLINDFCDDVLWLDRGRVREFGVASDIVGRYVHEMETLHRTPVTYPAVQASSGVELRVHENRFGSLELVLEQVRVLDSYEQPTAELLDDGPLTVELRYSTDRLVRNPIFGVTIVDTGGRVCFDTNSQGIDDAFPEAQGTGVVVARLERLPLANGGYFVEVGAYEHDWAYGYDYHAKAYPLSVQRPNRNGSSQDRQHDGRVTWSIR